VGVGLRGETCCGGVGGVCRCWVGVGIWCFVCCGWVGELGCGFFPPLDRGTGDGRKAQTPRALGWRQQNQGKGVLKRQDSGKKEKDGREENFANTFSQGDRCRTRKKSKDHRNPMKLSALAHKKHSQKKRCP